MLAINAPSSVIGVQTHCFSVSPAGLSGFFTGMPVSGAQTIKRLWLPGEYLFTGKPLFHGDHECENLQLKVSATLPSSVSGGPDLVALSQSTVVRSFGSSYYPRVPDNGSYYAADDIGGQWVAYVTRSPGLMFGNNPAGGVNQNAVCDACMFYPPIYNRTYQYRTRITYTFIGGRRVGLLERYTILRNRPSGSLDVATYSAYVFCGYYTTLTSNVVTWNGSWSTPSSAVDESRYGNPSSSTIYSAFNSDSADPFGILSLGISSPGFVECSSPYPPISVVGKDSISRAEEDLIIEYFDNLIKFSSAQLQAVTDDQLCDLCDSAVDNCHFVAIDSIAYLADFVRYLKLLVQVIHGDFGALPTSLSDLWLSGRYGARLTVSDTESLRAGVKRALNGRSPFETVHSRTSYNPSPFRLASSYHVDLAYKIYLEGDFNKMLKAIRKMMDWDIWPTLENDWDLIPFSFVLDWLVDIQGFLDDIDRRIYEQYLTVQSILWSERHQVTFGPGSIDCPVPLDIQDCKLVYYHRHHRSTFNVAPLRVQRGHLANINLVDGAMLLLQRRG